MDAIEWKHSYCIGIEEIDFQHQQLVKIINKILVVIREQRSAERINDIFNQLVDYTHYHFQAEEQYFVNMSASDKRLHQLQHSHFIEELESLQSQTLDFESIEATLFFLTDWLFNHILGEDRKLNGATSVVAFKNA